MGKPKLHFYFPGLPQPDKGEYRYGDSVLVWSEPEKGKEPIAVLIDGGQGKLFKKMVAKLKELGIRHVVFILTHWHQDHDDGLKAALNDPWIIVDEIYAPDPEELKLVPKDCGYDEYKRAIKILNLAKELKKRVVFPKAGKKVGHWVGKVRIWMWRQKANPNDTIDYQVNNTSIQVYFPDLEHLEGGDMINAKRFLSAYPTWKITTFSLWHHGNSCNEELCAALLARSHRPQLCYYSDWEPKGVSMGTTTFSKYGAGRAKKYFWVLRPFEDICAVADGEGHVTWTQGSSSYTYEIDYGAEFRQEKPAEETPAAQTPALRDMSVLIGPDVSYAQGKIDWNKLAPKIDFAIIQCGYGQNLAGQDDKQFKRNVAECERLGVPYGLYLYSYAGNTTRAGGEADHAIRLAKSCHPSLPIWYDLEENSLGNAAAANMDVWGKKLEDAGFWAGLYSFESFYNTYLKSKDKNRFTKWIAKFGANNGKMGNKPNVSNVDIWQYTSHGVLPGISSPYVDMNVMYIDLIKAVTGKDYIQAAKDVWADKYGSGEKRNAKLEAEGFDPRIVQHFVNRMKA